MSVFYKLEVSFWACVSRLTQVTQNNKFEISLRYLKENEKNEVGFLLADRHQRFLQIDTIILGVTRHAQITQNNKLAISLQYLKKKRVMKLICCMHVSMKVCCKLILWFLVGMLKHSQSFQNSKFSILLQYLLEMKLIFYKQINIKISHKLISTFWASNFSTKWYYHYWWACLSILKVLKVTSFQKLYNISKMKLVIKSFHKILIKKILQV